MLHAWKVYFIIKKAIKTQNVFLLPLLVHRNVQMSDYNVMLHSLLVVKYIHEDGKCTFLKHVRRI